MQQLSVQNQTSKRKIKDWITAHSAGIALIAGLWSLFRITGLIDMIFHFFSSPTEMREQIISFGFSVFFPGLDILSLVLAAAALLLGWIAMKRHGGFWKKGKGGFLIGVLCLILSFTPLGTACSLVSTTVPVWARTVYYGLTGQVDA